MDEKPRKECCTCVHWQRDGADGICWGGKAPGPTMGLAQERYALIWPRTKASERCRDWEGDPN